MISIIIRAYNNEQFISKAIESALEQSYNDIEVIVVNDGSTDNTLNVLQNFNDPRLKVINQENKGPIAAGYVGLQNSLGKFIIFLDGDDEFLRDSLEILFENLQKNHSAGFSYADYYEVDLRNSNKKVVSCENIFNTLACGILFKRSILDEAGFWDPAFKFPEYDMLLRIMKRYKGIHVEKPLYVYNRHPGSFTADKENVEQGKKELFAKYGYFKGFKEY